MSNVINLLEAESQRKNVPTLIPGDTVSDAAHGEDFLGPAAAATDHDAFEDLDPLARTLDHLRVHLDRIAGDQRGHVLALGLSVEQVNDVRHGVQG